MNNSPFRIRRFVRDDAERVGAIFYRSVHEVASAVYDQRQVDAWAPAQPDIEKWLPRLTTFDTFVAVNTDDDVVAWIAMSPIGYVDMLFCLPEAIGRGAAAQLYIAIEARAIERGVRRMTTHASLIAQPFFAKRGWQVDEHEIHLRPEWRGIAPGRHVETACGSEPGLTARGLVSPI
jgi:putative acetyltransferase